MNTTLYTELLRNVYLNQIKATDNDGGNTYWFDQEEGHHFGYCVGENQTSLITRGYPTFERWMQLFESAFNHGYYGVGMWLDTETNLCYTDRVKWITDLDHAILVAKRNNELAIYDLKEKECIDIQ